MKSVIFLVSAFVGSSVFAASTTFSQPVKYIEVSFGCQGSQPIPSQYAINIGFQSGEERLPDLRPRLQVNGTRLELAGVSSERAVVVGVIASAPTCDTSDSSYTQASWNAAQINPMTQVTASVTSDPESCYPLFHQGYAYGRNDQAQLRIENAYLREPQVFTWTEQKTFATLEECQNKN